VPAERTVHDILNRLGYRLRPVRKTKPQKNPETDAIFDHLRQVHTELLGTRKRSASRWIPRPR